ncbi:hypothetical protein EF903_18005 [Streptomyces sp. WAC05292]|uniref:hypothetical protein n=1 Tax=Streptomyces sp. WAC05292 TaxID=2487418 RepID=UPI000F7417ED|nr:hypothetical protein [Streptomyces sp. WAC05292]RSS87006.1 hypothetical protein EF903_18005 [Streptomyces sp. WAC05292]
MNPAVVPQLDAPHATSRPLDADRTAYLLCNADRPAAAAPVSGALVRSLLAAAHFSGGAAALEPDDGTVVLTYGQSASSVPGWLGPVFRAVPCDRPPRTPCCARCGHWKGEHDNPAVPTACRRYRLSIGPARFALPEHQGVTYAWVRRMGRTLVRFEISEPDDRFPGGALAVHRLPAPGDGPYAYCAHFMPIPPEQRTAVLKRARARVHPQPC